MRCKKHFSDHSSSVGVCASCLRHKLSTLSIHSQSQNPPIPNPNPKPKPNPNPNPPPLVLPRSVSPYKSGRPAPTHIQRFYSTPQVDLSHQRRKKNSGKFGLISKLFRSRSGKSQPSDQAAPTTSTSLSLSSSYSCYAKGMSPDRPSDEFDSPARSLPRPSPGRVRPSPARAGIALCLSPLLRPSPARQWNFGPDGGYSGEIRASTAGQGNSNKPHLSGAASFCANRSRKLADFGRSNWNH